MTGTPRAASAFDPPPDLLLVDGHVHVYDVFDAPAFLDAAAANLGAAAAALGHAGAAAGCLVLASTERTVRPEAFARRLRGSAWRLEATAEDGSWTARRRDGAALILVGGRQIAAAGRVEVLALGRDRAYPDGRPLAETVERVLDDGAVPVLPWAFGKWRALPPAAVQRLAERVAPRRFLFGDNAGRPVGLPPPALFSWAAQRCVPVLPGSDPLPLAHHGTRAGRYGFVLEGALDPERPAAGLCRLLDGLSGQPRPFGRRVGPFAFAGDQIRLRCAAAARPPGTAVGVRP